MNYIKKNPTLKEEFEYELYFWLAKSQSVEFMKVETELEGKSLACWMKDFIYFGL